MSLPSVTGRAFNCVNGDMFDITTDQHNELTAVLEEYRGVFSDVLVGYRCRNTTLSFCRGLSPYCLPPDKLAALKEEIVQFAGTEHNRRKKLLVTELLGLHR